MKKSTKLEIEQIVAKNLTFLPQQMMGVIQRFYDAERTSCEITGRDAEEVDDDSLKAIKNFLDEVVADDGD